MFSSNINAAPARYIYNCHYLVLSSYIALFLRLERISVQRISYGPESVNKITDNFITWYARRYFFSQDLDLLETAVVYLELPGDVMKIYFCRIVQAQNTCIKFIEFCRQAVEIFQRCIILLLRPEACIAN